MNTNNAFTRDLLRTLVATVRAQPDETEAEYAERFNAVTAAWASYRPRDTQEQMLASQIVGAHYAALDCLSNAVQTDDQAQIDHRTRSHTAMIRTMQNMIRLLADQQQRPLVAAPPMPAIELIPPPRRRPPAPKIAQQPMHRENSRAGRAEEMKDPATMTDAELAAALSEARGQATAALFDNKDPLHRDALRTLQEILPGIVIPDAWFDDPLPTAA